MSLKLLEASNHESYDNHCNSRLEMMSDQQVRDEVMTIFLAGHETTANALTWTFYLLSQNTKIEAKIHEELDDVLDPIDKITSVADIQWLHYTEKVFIESMRLYPPVWLIGRTVNSKYAISKYAIPAGSLLLMSQYIMHHDSHYYKQPEQFQPDRWTLEFKNSLPRFAYFPFGGGIRGCIGETFAWMEGILTIASISRRWKLRTVDNQRVELDAGITLRPKYGMKMKIRSR